MTRRKGEREVRIKAPMRRIIGEGGQQGEE